MKLLILGATGRMGRQLVAQALARGDQVTALVRRPEKLAPYDSRIRILQGDVTDEAAPLDTAVEGQDAVVSSLGVVNVVDPGHLIARTMQRLVPAMERQGVSRLVLVSAFGVGETHREAPPFPRLMYRLLLRKIFADKLAGEDRVRASSLDWTFVYPVLLTDGPRTGRYRAGEHLALTGVPKVSRADVADFVLQEIERRAYLRKIAVVSQ